MLSYCRFSLLVVIVGAAGILLTGQGNELTIRLQGDISGQLAFFLSSIIWAWQRWYWSRLILEDRSGVVRVIAREDGLVDFADGLLNYLPRLIGAAAFIAAAGAAFKNEVWWGFVLIAIFGFPSFCFWIIRRKSQRIKGFTALGAIGRGVRYVSYTILAALAISALFNPVWTGYSVDCESHRDCTADRSD